MPTRIDNPAHVKAEGLCNGYPYDTQLVSIDGVCIHFWLSIHASPGLAEKLERSARRQRDIVYSTYSDGMPDGFWAHENI